MVSKAGQQIGSPLPEIVDKTPAFDQKNTFQIFSDAWSRSLGVSRIIWRGFGSATALVKELERV